ncbi:hypothetical protein [Ruegeria jejuensis]|uniref:hypothetical protein n=1 Tax=Ruegeria jejuensis TaxID=3233338 RepID=UPI00355C8435
MKVQFSRIVARSRTNVTLVGLPEFIEEAPGQVEPFTPWCFVISFDEGRIGDKWVCQELEQSVARLLIIDDPETGRSSYASMSFDGEFNRFLPSGIATEQVPEAGLKGGSSSWPDQWRGANWRAHLCLWQWWAIYET